jgi:peptidoglycan/xylan/chitin deacetylase (PgdA/CDA1 family)
VNSAPHYYSSLRSFEKLFSIGTPILTYHHVGPRPRGARLKGLYVSPSLFEKQIKELKAAGRIPASFSGFELEQATASVIYLTFDDGFLDVYRYALPILRQQNWVGIQFLVSKLIGQSNLWQQRAGDVFEPLMDVPHIKEWLAAGQGIGSHTQTHPHLTRLPPSQAREEISASKKELEDQFGVPVRHFCYPYGDWNESIRDMVIEAGYQTACTTITGINTKGEDVFALKRFTARYPSRNLKAIRERLAIFVMNVLQHDK